MPDSIGKKITTWQQSFGRNNLPWQQNITPYRVWVSEIMLQQTQVSTAIPYYNRFMHTFPTVDSLAKAHEATVIEHWAGLGYYQRARNLHKTSQIVHNEYQSIFPKTPESLIQLPGIGKSTAHAILSICHDAQYPILDGNVKRVLSRYYGIQEAVDKADTIKHLWHLASQAMPQQNCRIYTQGIMDLGATICHKKPQCPSCPLQDSCMAYQKNIQTQIPVKKPKNKKRKQDLYCLCYFHKGKLLMQQRDETGIWPKLWCPPIQKLLSSTENNHSVIRLPHYKHILTHIEMTIHPLIVLTRPENQLPTGKWLDEKQALTIGIPSAIKKLILNQSLFKIAKNHLSTRKTPVKAL